MKNNVIIYKYGTTHNLIKMWGVQYKMPQYGETHWTFYNKYKSRRAMMDAMRDLTKSNGWDYRPIKIEYEYKEYKKYHSHTVYDVEIKTQDLSYLVDRKNKLERIIN